jgi:hypothetical protein
MGRFRSYRSVTLPTNLPNTRCLDVATSSGIRPWFAKLVRKIAIFLVFKAGDAVALANSAEAAIDNGALTIWRTGRCEYSLR